MASATDTDLHTGAAPSASVTNGDKFGEASSNRAPASGDRSQVPLGRLFLVLALLFVAGAALYLTPPEWQTEAALFGLSVFAALGVLLALMWGVGWIGRARDLSRTELPANYVSALGEGICLTDQKGKILFANPAYYRLTGANNAAGLRSVETLFSQDPDAADAIYRMGQMSRDGQAAEEEVRLPSPLRFDMATASDPGGAWYQVAARPIAPEPRDQLGHGKSMTAWRVADITKSRKAQERIFQDLQAAIDYLDHAPAGFLSVSPDGTLNYLNATLASWLGIDIAQTRPGELHLYDLIDGPAAVHLLNQEGALIVPAGHIFDLDFATPAGGRIPVRLLHDVPKDDTGAAMASRTLVLNRSAESSGDNAANASEVRLARFFNSSPIAIAAVTRDRRLGRCNGQFVSLFGHKHVEGRQSDFVNAIVERDRPALRAALTAAINGKTSIEPVEVTLAERAGQADGSRVVKIFVSAVEANEDHEAATIFALDTTEQRALEEQFAQSQKMQAIGQLAGGVAHDFNNVLTAIIGFSDLLLASHKPSDPSFPDIMNIKQNANRAAGLVRQLLAFSRRQTLRPQVLHLADVMNEISVMLDRLLGEKVKLKVHHGRDLWPVKADLNQFEQVIMNLAVNARDAMPDGGIVEVTTTNVLAAELDKKAMAGAPEVDYVLIEVSDTGTGMAPEVIDKVFEPFFTTKSVGQGTGLGLSTVYGIIKQTGGFIYVDSVVGEGTNFRILLPRHIEDEAVVDTKVDKPKDAEKKDLTGNAAILLVEDEEAVRAFAARALASRGYKVYEAGTGSEAIEMMEEVDGAIDLVISDVMMPEMDGPTLLRTLRETQPDLKIILVSGYAEDAFAKNLDEGEAFRFLPKPFSLKQLATAVKDALSEA